jgi:hypothetical protein
MEPGWRNRSLGVCLWRVHLCLVLSSLFFGCDELSSSYALPYVQSNGANHKVKPPKPGAKIELSWSKLLFTSISSQWWKVTNINVCAFECVCVCIPPSQHRNTLKTTTLAVMIGHWRVGDENMHLQNMTMKEFRISCFKIFQYTTLQYQLFWGKVSPVEKWQMQEKSLIELPICLQANPPTGTQCSQISSWGFITQRRLTLITGVATRGRQHTLTNLSRTILSLL